MNPLAKPSPAQALRLALIIAGAMLMGLLTFMGVVWTIANGRAAEQGELAILLSGVSALTTVTAFLVPDLVISQQVKRLVEEQEQSTDRDGLYAAVVPLWLNRQIITYGLLEGGALLNGVGYLLTAQFVSLVVMGVIAGLFLTTIPSEQSQQDWIAQQLKRHTPS